MHKNDDEDTRPKDHKCGKDGARVVLSTCENPARPCPTNPKTTTTTTSTTTSKTTTTTTTTTDTGDDDGLAVGSAPTFVNGCYQFCLIIFSILF